MAIGPGLRRWLEEGARAEENPDGGTALPLTPWACRAILDALDGRAPGPVALTAAQRRTLGQIAALPVAAESVGACAAALAVIDALTGLLSDLYADGALLRVEGAMRERRFVLALLRARATALSMARYRDESLSVHAAADEIEARGEPPDPPPWDQLRAENDRLRKALGEIAGAPQAGAPDARSAAALAREALA